MCAQGVCMLMSIVIVCYFLNFIFIIFIIIIIIIIIIIFFPFHTSFPAFLAPSPPLPPSHPPSPPQGGVTLVSPESAIHQWSRLTNGGFIKILIDIMSVPLGRERDIILCVWARMTFPFLFEGWGQVGGGGRACGGGGQTAWRQNGQGKERLWPALTKGGQSRWEFHKITEGKIT